MKNETSEKRMKQRVALLGVLLLAGFLMAGIGGALGAEKLFPKKVVEIRGIVSDNASNEISVYEDDKLVQSFTLPEGEEYTKNTSDGEIRIGRIKEGIDRGLAANDADSFMETAKKDSLVQELISGKNYKVLGFSAGGTIKPKNNTTITYSGFGMLSLEVEGKYYRIAMDMNSGEVLSIDEQDSGKTEACFGTGCK